LVKLISIIAEFLRHHLKLELHPEKVVIRKLKQDIDFLGYVVLPHHKTLRTKTKNRMLKKINQKNSSSYLGLLKHCCGYKLRRDCIIRAIYNFLKENFRAYPKGKL